jgi:ankyrin repeat protein
LYCELQQALRWSDRAGLAKNVPQLAWAGKAECVRSIGRWWWRIDIPFDDSLQRVEKRISFGEMPDRQGQFPSWLEYSQHLANRVNRRWKEHHTEAADNGIEGIGWERQMVCKGDFKLYISDRKMVCRSTSGRHHLGNGIDPKDLAFRSDQGSHAQCRISGTGSNVQNCVTTAKLPILDKSLRDRREHLPYDFAVLLPERCNAAPSVYNLLVGLHEQSIPSGQLTSLPRPSLGSVVWCTLLASRKLKMNIRVRTRQIVLCVCLWSGIGIGAPTGKQLLDALRDGNLAAVRQLVKSGAPVNAVDDFDSSALMYAALYADVTTVQLLLEKGADPNHADKAGATALMWAIPDEAKCRVLIARGARVNAVSEATGRTPVLIAAGRPGASGIVRMLLDKGADPKARDKNNETTLLRAALSGDPNIMKLLIDRGVDINAATSRGGVTPLLEAIAQNDSEVLDMLIAKGADLKARDQEGFNVLTSATAFGNVPLFRKLIDKGADPAARNDFGADLLISVASSDTGSLDLVRDLVKRGADPKAKVANLHARKDSGKNPEGPLDWANRLGDTPVTRLLCELTGEQRPGEPNDERPHLRAGSPRQAIGKALPLLYDGGREFFKRSGCTSCHHNVLPAIAFSQARSAGLPVDEEKARRNSLQSVAWITGSQDGFLQDVRVPGADTTAAYLLWGLAADGHRRDRATDAVAHHLAGAQALDGGWRVRADRAPIESSRVTPTAIAIRALRAYPIPGRKAEFDTRVRVAAKWLAGYQPRTGEEKSMRLLGLVWAGADASLLRDAAVQLVAQQRADGGWAQLDTLGSDAYATGQALYALHNARHLSGPALQKGVRFLLDSQLADGSWHIRSRSYPLQVNYFETGFPHGRDQWISAAGTSWACIGLSLAVKP